MASLRAKATIFPISVCLLALAIADFVMFTVVGSLPPLALVVSLVLLAVVVLASLVHARQLVHPINELMPTIDREGHLELRSTAARITPPVELQALTKAIDQLAESQQRDKLARQKLERVRSEFLANVSHELRTPIFAVQGFIETLLDGAVDDPKVNRDFLERARVQSERLNSLLNDLIDISRIESGEMRMSFRMFDIQPFLRDFTSEMQPMARAKHIELYFTGNVLPHHEVSVFADKERIKQVLINLTDNAIKYSNEGTAIKIELIDDEASNDQVTIRVVDNGIGIAPEHLPRLFERFYRVDKGRARSAPGGGTPDGTGLGLAIVKHIIEAHHGKISVMSEPGKGSTFQFTLRKDSAWSEVE